MFILQNIIFVSLIASEVLCGVLFKNDGCLINKQKGRCVIVNDCLWAIQGIKNGTYPKICSFEGNNPIVCCLDQNIDHWNQNETNSNQTNNQSNQNGSGEQNAIHRELHEEKCREFLNEINSKKDEKGNGFFVSIVGGTNAKVGEFPHMALLGYGNKPNIQWNCGGSLISKKYILTAAHCLTHPTLGGVKFVRLGDIRLDGSSGSAQDFTVIRSIRHPEYKPPVVYNDIALLELNKQVVFNKNIKPACFHAKDDVSKIPEVTATGWGLTEFGGNPANIIQVVDLDIFSHQECNNTYKNNKRRIPDGIIDSKQICAGGKRREQDTCQGDSGGPIQWRENGWNDLHKIIGVTSLGKGCGTINVPAIYTRVSYYLPWIENIVFSSDKLLNK